MKTGEEYEATLKKEGFKSPELEEKVTKHLGIVNSLGGYELLKVKEVEVYGSRLLEVAGMQGISFVLPVQVIEENELVS